MTREEFAVLVKGMKAVYAQDTFMPDKDAFDIWYQLLAHLDYSVASAAIQIHMRTSKYVPKPADIIEQADYLCRDSDLGELEAWALVYKAICRSGYYAEEEFEKLPAVVQKAVGNPANLKEWSTMRIETIQSVEQSHFIRSYRAEKGKKPNNEPCTRKRA